MSRLKSIFRNLRTLLADDLQNRWQSEDARTREIIEQIGAGDKRTQESLAEIQTRADVYETSVDTRLSERLAAIEIRIDEYQAAIDARIDDRATALESRLDEYQKAVDARIEDRVKAIEKSLADYQAAIDDRMDERLTAIESSLDARLTGQQEKLDTRADAFESALTTRINAFEHSLASRASEFEGTSTARADSYESALDARIENRLTQAEATLETRIAAGEAKLDEASASLLNRIDEHFDARSLSTDNRLDDRLARIERHIDTRFDTLEKRSDDRMETHERTVDGKLHQRSQDIVDRNDLMLQIFDQQLDKFRRQLGSLDARFNAAGAKGNASSENGGGAAAGHPQVEADDKDADPPRQLVSFRKLAGSGAQQLRKAANAAPALYHQILSWKKTAHEGLNDFSPDEQEIVDYILSFLSDDQEIAYVQQHLRRFVATVERVPPPEGPEDRLLELGSLGHLTPAIRKFCGYTEVFGGDLWEGDERVRIETVRQVNGSDQHSFELRNFNVETDKFPYPDGFFKTVLCCELIEHLQRDPLHMLWECNRVLADSGYLLLTTPNIASARAIEGLLVGCTPYLLSQFNLKNVVGQHNREYAPYEIGVVLAASGFSVVALETEDVWLRSNPALITLLKEIQISTDLRADNIFALARKVSAPIERYPAELYTDRDE